MSAKLISICRKCSTVALFLLFFQSLFAQQTLPALNAIAAERSKSLKQEVVLALATADTTTFVADSKTFSAIRGQAPLGQSSQWLTAALVVILVDEGKISLDDKVSQYLPVFTSYRKGYITIRQCLSHLTGIYTETNKAFKLLQKKKFASLEEMVAEYPKREIQNNPGEAFRYSVMGPDIAGRVLEVVAKKKFDLLAQQKLFRPLGMRQTSFGTLDGSAISPSSGARTTAADYLKFLRMLLNGGLHQGQRILSESSVAALRQVLTSVDNRKLFPEAAAGFEYAAGSWAAEASNNKANLLIAPSFEGTVAAVDFCRGYAFVYLQKELDDEARVPVFKQVKSVLDGVYPAKCK